MNHQQHAISPNQISLKQLGKLWQNNTPIELSTTATELINRCRAYLDQKITTENRAFYGINTGFGILCDVQISNTDLAQLQHNLLVSHACGMGTEVPTDVVKLMLLLKIQSLSYGYSGVQLATVQRLVDMYNLQILPVVYEQGSLGASGDLAPLSHLSLPLLGLGEVNYKGKRQKSADVLHELGWEPIVLQSKEGLALINGTQFMSAYAVWALLKAKHLLKTANLIAALSLDGFDGRIDAFNPLIHQMRNQKGQQKVAKAIRKYMRGSQIALQPKQQVQDPYSFRCVPQVHGASADTIDMVHKIVEREINAVTDNPNIFVDDDLIVSGGNFHGQPLALNLDFLAIAAAELGSISERRTYKLIGGRQNLPPMLIENGGLNSGLMIPQYTAAAIVSQNKQLCSPASVDSITSSNGQEDHVSMGANAATKCYRVLQNLERVLAIELLTAAQALSLRKKISGLVSSQTLENLLDEYRQTVPFLTTDRLLHTDLDASVLFVQNNLGKYF
jgi:histidine ammonia-lyase